MTSCSSMDICHDESGECGQTESCCLPYVREQNPPALEGASDSVNVKV